ncbi:MAG: polyphosphate polymerase domain-containing protein [Flavobacteriales bacterium]
MSINLTEILSGFRPITLAEMDGVQLMNRTDTKFMFSKKQLAEMLPDLVGVYSALEVEGVRQSRYETLYYDTEDFFHYIQHQNGKIHRYKIRKREYVESSISFLEVKEKNNKGRTFKSRIKLKEMVPVIDERGQGFVNEKAHNTHALVPKIWNSYNRTTLVDTVAGERVTLDTDLAFYYNNQRISLDDFVIAEVKQDGANRHSRFMKHMKRQLHRPEGISKYCLGVALLYPEVKSNNFKEKILRIKKITNANAA